MPGMESLLGGPSPSPCRWEGITYDPKRRQLYTSLSSIRYGEGRAGQRSAADCYVQGSAAQHI